MNRNIACIENLLVEEKIFTKINITHFCSRKLIYRSFLFKKTHLLDILSICLFNNENISTLMERASALQHCQLK